MMLVRYALIGAGLSVLLLFAAAYVARNTACSPYYGCVWHGQNSVW